MRVLALDPSMHNWGWASFIGYSLVDIGIIQYEPQQSRYKNTAEYMALAAMAKPLQCLVNCHDLLVVEMPVGSQSASAMKSYGFVLGLLAGIFPYPDKLVTISQRQSKITTCDDPKATKKDMIEWATNLYPNADWPKNGTKYNLSKCEHIADAIAACYTYYKGLNHENLYR